MRRHYQYILFLVALLSACATNGPNLLTQAKSPEQRVALAYKTYEAAHDTNAYLVRQKRITATQAQVVYNNLEISRQHLDAAQKLVRSGDPALSSMQLRLAETTLEIANDFLNANKPK